MAVTFAVTNLRRSLDGGAYRSHRGTITATGTTSDDGDTAAASLFGLSLLDDLQLTSPFVDSTSNPELSYQGRFNRASGKIVLFGTNAVPGAAVADPQITDGTTVTGYSAEFVAIGR